MPIVSKSKNRPYLIIEIVVQKVSEKEIENCFLAKFIVMNDGISMPQH